MKSEKILIIENDSAVIQLIKTHLEMEGFEIHVFRSGAKALERYFDSSYDLVILGWMHTSPPGIEICRQLRIYDQHTPIIMLSARRSEENVAEMFEAGVDDCVSTPFRIRELSARIRTILQLYKRAKQILFGRFEGKRIEIDGLVIDSNVHRVTMRDAAVKLTAKEYDLLYLLASNPGKVFSKRLLLDLLWDHDADVYEHTVNSHINRLRGKIEKSPRSPKYILTEWGLGYRFTDRWNR
ncbi:MAG TPA: response regulator transcription factor [Patescibacteria group bacterium]|nr:response regulator transcription factor [Patescibacteria group bacterium]